MHRQSRPEYLRNVRTEPLSTLHKFYAIPSRWMARIQTSVVPWSGLRTPSFVKASCSLCMHLSPLVGPENPELCKGLVQPMYASVSPPAKDRHLSVVLETSTYCGGLYAVGKLRSVIRISKFSLRWSLLVWTHPREGPRPLPQTREKPSRASRRVNT
jgi:hypothetical protein